MFKNQALIDELIAHAKQFGPLNDVTGSPNIEYLAGIELICNRYEPLKERDVITVTKTEYVHYESNGCDCGQVSCPVCG